MSEEQQQNLSLDLFSSSSFPLLKDEERDDEPLSRQKSRFSFMPLVHAVIFSIYTLAFLTLAKFLRGQNCHPDFIYSPARSAIRYERSHVSNELTKHGSPYTGPPSPEGDQAWNGLINKLNIRITHGELKKLNRSTIQLQDGSGDYYGSLMVTHNLHCIRYLRMAFYKDYYHFPEGDWYLPHIDHCLEGLRQEIMCKPDISILTYDWLPNYTKPWPKFYGENECANWDTLDAWVTPRVFDGYGPSALIHPDMGPMSPDGPSHPSPEAIQSLADGTNPKNVNYDPEKRERPKVGVFAAR